MAERLAFDGSMPYGSVLAAEHISRYLLVRRFCPGRRVLDIACGEGYGAALMMSWGAREVVGVDISTQAVATAQRLFGGPGRSFLVHDAGDCAALASSLGRFDVIACFETIEHVEDPERMLEGFKSLLAPDGVIVVSCPNDAATVPDRPNEFHLKIYSFEEFLTKAEKVLGPSTSALLGAPALGIGIFDPKCSTLSSRPNGIEGLMRQENAHAIAIPAQDGHQVDAVNSSFYVASWGGALEPAAVMAPISFQAYETPWNNWVAARARVDELEDQTRRLAGQEGLTAAYKAENEAALAAAQAGRQALIERLNAIESSRWHAVMLFYYKLYGLPVIGPILRAARRLGRGSN